MILALKAGVDIELPETDCYGSNLIKAVRWKNIGPLTGDEVVQLYINDEYASRTRPIKELKVFKRVTLQAGESKKIRFTLLSEQLAKSIFANICLIFYCYFTYTMV